MNQGYCRLVAKYKQGLSDFYWDANLDRVQRKRNNQMRDAINKAARFIINRCLADRVGNERDGLERGWKASGQRVQRGLYKTAKGFLVNADCNAAAKCDSFSLNRAIGGQLASTG